MIKDLELIITQSQSIELSNLILIIDKGDIKYCAANKVRFNFIPNTVQLE